MCTYIAQLVIRWLTMQAGLYVNIFLNTCIHTLSMYVYLYNVIGAWNFDMCKKNFKERRRVANETQTKSSEALSRIPSQSASYTPYLLTYK